MINYYYELNEDVIKMYGRTVCRYLAQFDVHPGTVTGGFNWTWHDEAMKHSSRVRLENANGVSLVKPDGVPNSSVDPVEFTWIKLKCRDIATL